MSKTTIVRRIDDLGRLVLPKDVRKSLNIHTGDLLELTVKEDTIAIAKYSSIQEIKHLGEVLLTTVYERYHIEGFLLEEKQIISYPPHLSLKKLEEKKKEKDFLESPILLENKEVGKMVFCTKDEKYQELLSFLTFFLKKYLEEC